MSRLDNQYFSKIVDVSSDELISGSDSNFIVNLGKPDGVERTARVAIKYCSFFNVFPNVSTGVDDVFQIAVSPTIIVSTDDIFQIDVSGPGVQSYTVAAGTYTAATLASTIVAGVNALSGMTGIPATLAINTAVSPWNFTVTGATFKLRNFASGSTISPVLGITTTSASFAASHAADRAASAGNISFTLPSGFYSNTVLAAAIVAGINATAQMTAIPATLAIDTTAIDGKWVFTMTGATFVLETAAQGSTISPLIGIYAPSGTPAATQDADSLPNLAGLTQVYLRSSALAPANMYRSGNNLISDTFAVIPVGSPYGALVQYPSVSLPLELNQVLYDAPKDISSIDLRLTDRSGNILDLQNHPLKLTLQIWYTPAGYY